MTFSPPRIGVVLSTIRQGRFADIPTDWIQRLAVSKDDLVLDVVDLRQHPLPLYGDDTSPTAQTRIARWQERMATFDGYIFVTAEYNHSIPGPFKNALDYLGAELHRKPATFIGYGGIGSARAIEQLRQIVIEFQMAPLRNAVHIGMEPYLAVVQSKATLDSFEFLNDRGTEMLNELSWWARALRTARDTPDQQDEEHMNRGTVA